MSDERDPNCRRCNYDMHSCPGCGEPLDHGVNVCGACLEEAKSDKLGASSPPFGLPVRLGMASRLDATVPIEAIDPTHPDHYAQDWCRRGFCDCRSAVSDG